jgi:hypothetical protein
MPCTALDTQANFPQVIERLKPVTLLRQERRIAKAMRAVRMHGSSDADADEQTGVDAELTVYVLPLPLPLPLPWSCPSSGFVRRDGCLPLADEFGSSRRLSVLAGSLR